RSKRDWSADVCSSDLHSGMVANHSVRALRPLVRKSGSCAPELFSMPTCPSPAPSRAVSGLSLLSVSPSAMRLATCRIDRSLRQLVLSVSDSTSVESEEKRLILSALEPRDPEMDCRGAATAVAAVEARRKRSRLD